ncbi:TetR/AcrR family transcriptional regulator [Deinococcus cellulosilyticus]|uniref:TetR family transcriptional regulator n=1 Tax=Deinococcus cellulosilyticus (strain DSM 18568 / NBRC 106333 / KACC 11606 / 5516J-15) TaxID=1223518 RepID=A0A511N0V9_DEIC1|nr:TetR/AcrR family transcriptional regulator [Deinococcus cellulosilyticus]GEM46502.1 TetR family transcriptional regulator [Deinococcus cellulosilyticus NBRC 106333 = KACC 11606]
MSRSRPYHHGQLRDSLIQALLSLAQDTPLAQISLREVAKKAGVSHAAPYHHFESKEAMIEAATIECLRHLSQTLQTAVEALPEKTHPVEKIKELGKAYIRFALQRSTEYQFINRTDVCNFQNMSSRLREVSQEAIHLLTRLVLEAQALGALRKDDPGIQVLALWSTVQGLANLLLLGFVLPDQVEDTVSAVMDSGLGRFGEPS